MINISFGDWFKNLFTGGNSRSNSTPITVPCPNCFGTGKVQGFQCLRCNGKGNVPLT